ncbi:MAG: Na+/H+ antiporter [Terriglobia bacterium]
MQTGSMHAVEILFLLLLLVVAAFAALARKLQTPYPIVLVLAGLLLSFLPGLPKITLNPDIIFFVVLPPLLYSAAWLTSWREFSRNLVTIFFLAFGLVGFTVFGVAETAHWVFPGFDWRLGFALGAVVATTDAIAATSIAKRIGLPQRIVDVLEGESLVNDATGLLALEFAIAIIVHGQTPSAASAALRLGYVTVAGLTVGLLVGLAVYWFERRIDDGPIEITISILVPYAGYLAAEAIHASGVLAVVACGLYLSRRSTDLFSPSVRIQAYAVWNSLTFVLNGLVFVLIGLQLPYVLAGIRDHSLRTLLLYGALFSALVIVLRLLWMFPGAYLPHLIRSRILQRSDKPPSARQVFVIGWTGMRGVLALAAAISLPVVLADGRPFPQRNLIIFLTFCVILVTLVVQGLTLPMLIRLLGLAGAPGSKREEEEARRIVLEAALAHLEQARSAAPSRFSGVYDDLEQHYRNRLATLTGERGGKSGGDREVYARFRDLSRELLRVERQAVIRLRKAGRISDEVLRQLEHELDLSETRHRTGVGDY